MSLETGTYISDLVTSNPLASDVTSQGDDHIRLLKSTLQSTFPATGKAFRFPNDVTAITSPYTVLFPEDQNKIIPVNTTSGNITITLPTPSGENANGWSFTLIKTVAANTINITGTVNGITTFKLRRQYEAVTFLYISSSSSWIALAKFSDLASGTKAFFGQTTAPVGWTKTTDASYNDRALRLVTGTVGPTGGNTNFTSVFASRTIAQGNLPNVSLSGLTSTDGNHTHAYIGPSDSMVGSDGSGAQAYQLGRVSDSNGAHFHSVTVSLGGAGTAMDFAVKYVDAILATKD